MNPADTLREKVCVITGASRTLGAEIARSMARYGAIVIVNYFHSVDAAFALCEELDALGGEGVPFQADISKPDEMTRLLEEVWARYDRIDILVNNVGHFTEKPYLELPIEEFDTIHETNVRATFVAMQVAGRRMKVRGEGSIVNIAATDAFHRTHTAYGLAKAGVIHLTEGMALELAPEVRVNAIAPDLIADNEDMSASLVQSAVGGTPLRRLVTRAEIAEMTCLLCTPVFSSVTGRTLVMDGGRSIPRLNAEEK